MTDDFFLNIDFEQFMNHNFTILGSRLYSPNLKDVTALEDSQLIFNFPYICLYFFPREPHLPSQIYRQMNRKLDKLTECLLVKLHPSNVVNTIFYLVF